jgi:hypothetical protein
MRDRPAWLAERWAEANELRDNYLARVPKPTPLDAWEAGARWAWAVGLGLASVGLPEESGTFGARVIYPSGNAWGWTFKDRVAPDTSERMRLAAHLRTLADQLEQDEKDER